MKPLTFKESKQLLFAPIIENNPIALQILGICSALAVTVKMDVTLVMCAALTSVVALSNFFISLLRFYIPENIRIIFFNLTRADRSYGPNHQPNYDK